MPKVAIPRPGARRGRPAGKITDKQLVWIGEYVVDMNGARAAEAAGYRHPAVAAAKLLNPALYPHVVREVQRRLAEKRQVCMVEARQLVEQLAKIAFLDPRRLFNDAGEPIPMHELPEDVAVALARWEVIREEGADGAARVRRLAVRFHNKLTALRLMAVLLGYWPARFVAPQDGAAAEGIGLTADERREVILSLVRAAGHAGSADVPPDDLGELPPGDDGPMTDDVPPLF